MASQKVKGLRIELSADTTAVSSALSEVNKSLNGTQKELNNVNKLLKLDPKNINLLTQKQGLLSDAIDKTKQKIEQLNKVKELADKDSNVDKNTKEYRELVQQLEQARIKYQQLNNEVVRNDEALDKASAEASNFKDIFSGTFVSSLAISGLEMLTSAILQVGNAMVSVVTDSAKWADEVNTLAKQYNLSTKEIQQYQKASELIDVDLNTIAKSMSRLTKNMNSGSKSVVGAFKQLNVETKNADGSLRDSNEVFNEIIESLALIENETEQDALAMEIFGKSASDLGPLINGGAEQLKEFNKYLEDNNLLLSQGELDQLNELNDSFDMLDATLEGFKEKASVSLAPIIQPFIDGIATFINEHQDDINNFLDKIIEWFTSEDTKQFFKDFGQLLLDVWDILTGITDIIDKLGIFDLAIAVIQTAWEAVLEVVKDIKQVVQDIIDMTNGDFDWNVGFGPLEYTGQGPRSGGFGEYQSGGYNRNMTSNLTINVNTNQLITENQVRGWAEIINEQLGQMV